MKRLPVFMAGLLALMLTGIVSEAAAGPKSINSCTTITKPGAYVVTRNINASAVAGDCIIVDQSHVTLNLGGMVIAGPGAFAGVAGGHGVHVLCCDKTNVEVRNGTVTGFVSGVVFEPSASGAIVERVRAVGNEGVGINVRDDAILTRNYATGNLNFGILFGSGGVVMRNVTNGNTGSGMQGECDSVVMFNTSVGNGGTDLSITGSAVDVNCVVSDNATTSP